MASGPWQDAPPVPGPSEAHNYIKLVRNMAVEGVVESGSAADKLQALAYQALVVFEEASKAEQEVRRLPAPVCGRMPKPLSEASEVEA